MSLSIRDLVSIKTVSNKDIDICNFYSSTIINKNILNDMKFLLIKFYIKVILTINLLY